MTESATKLDFFNQHPILNRNALPVNGNTDICRRKEQQWSAERVSTFYYIDFLCSPYPKMVPRRDWCSTSPDLVAIKNNVDLQAYVIRTLVILIGPRYACLTTYNIIPLVVTQAVTANKT